MLDGRQHRRQALRRGHRDAGHGPDRGQCGRHRQADPADPPRLRRQDPGRPRRAPVAGGGGRPRGRAGLAAFSGTVACRRRTGPPHQPDRQRTRFAARRCPGPVACGRRAGGSAGGIGQTRCAPCRERRRHRRRAGLRGRWAHRGDRVHGPGARGRRRSRRHTGPGRRRDRHRPAGGGRTRTRRLGCVDGVGVPDRCRVRPRCS